MTALPPTNDERGQDDADRAAPERARSLEHDQAERGVHETEGGEPRERDEVREEPDDGVDELDAGLGQRRGAVPGLEHEAEREQHETDAADDGTGDLEREELGVDAPGEKEATDEDRQSGDAELSEQRLPEAAAPPAVHDTEHIADRQQHGADREADEQQLHRLLQRVEPERRHEAGRAERLAVQQAEEHPGEAGGERESPTGCGRTQSVPSCGRAARATSSTSTRPWPTSPNMIPNMRTKETTVNAVGSRSPYGVVP